MMMADPCLEWDKREEVGIARKMEINMVCRMVLPETSTI